jgi:GTP-binding protein
MLTAKKDLARVSATPGHTRQLNFFLINEKWRLVDLPGYGYAKASAEKKEQFRELVSTYLAERENLSCVFQLIDSRLDPQKIDLEFSTWLGVSGIPFVLAFTKSDKLKPNKARAHVAAYLELLAETCDGEPRTFLCSAHEAYGRREILDFIDKATKAAS